MFLFSFNKEKKTEAFFLKKRKEKREEKKEKNKTKQKESCNFSEPLCLPCYSGGP